MVKSKGESSQNKAGWTSSKLFLLLYIPILLIGFFSIYNKVFDEKINLGGDNVGYYILGNSIASGQGYKNIHTMEKSPHNHFPPGYPVIIAGAIKLGNNDISYIKKVNGFFFLMSLLFLFLVIYRITGNLHLPFLTCLFLLVNYNLLDYSVTMMSEIPFLFFTLLSLWIFMKTDFDKPILKNFLFFILIIILAFTYHIRSTGLALLVAMLAVLTVRKRWWYFVTLFSGFVALGLPWFFRTQKLGGNPYIHQLFQKNPYRPELGEIELSDWFSRFWINLERYITREIPYGSFNFVSYPEYKQPIGIGEWIIGLVILALIVFGALKLRKYSRIIVFYTIAYFGIILLWPEVWKGIRFILPLIPLLFFLFVNGLVELVILISSHYFKYSNRKIIYVVLVVLGLMTIYSYGNARIQKLNKRSKSYYPTAYGYYFELARWVKENTADTAIVCCRKGQMFYIFSHRYVTGFKNTLDREEQIEYLKEKSVDYVILDKLGYASTERYLYPAIERYRDKFKQLKHLKDPHTFLLQFRPDLGYSGDFKNNERHGKGTFVWEDGKKFVGEFKDGKRHGEGILYYPNGTYLEGTWIDDVLTGEGYFRNEDGKLLKTIRVKPE